MKKELKGKMPAYFYQNIFVVFAAFKHHIGFYLKESAVKAFAKELSGYKTAMRSVLLPSYKGQPPGLIR